MVTKFDKRVAKLRKAFGDGEFTAAQAAAVWKIPVVQVHAVVQSRPDGFVLVHRGTRGRHDNPSRWRLAGPITPSTPAVPSATAPTPARRDGSVARERVAKLRATFGDKEFTTPQAEAALALRHGQGHAALSACSTFVEVVKRGTRGGTVRNPTTWRVRTEVEVAPTSPPTTTAWSRCLTYVAERVKPSRLTAMDVSVDCEVSPPVARSYLCVLTAGGYLKRGHRGVYWRTDLPLDPNMVPGRKAMLKAAKSAATKAAVAPAASEPASATTPPTVWEVDAGAYTQVYVTPSLVEAIRHFTEAFDARDIRAIRKVGVATFVP